MHIKYIKINFILTREKNSSRILFSVKVQRILFSCACNSCNTLLYYKQLNSSEIFQNQISDLAVQLPLHLMKAEYLNTLFAFEPMDLSMSIAHSLASFSMKIHYPLHLKKKKFTYGNKLCGC